VTVKGRRTCQRLSSSTAVMTGSTVIWLAEVLALGLGPDGLGPLAMLARVDHTTVSIPGHGRVHGGE
jgi:hypothetical protein